MFFSLLPGRSGKRNKPKGLNPADKPKNKADIMGLFLIINRIAIKKHNTITISN